MASGLTLLAAAALGSSCSKSCDDYASASLTVYVKAASGADVCDAVVTATDGREVFPLEINGCSYAGPWERSGTYVVTVSHDGHESSSDPVRVRSGECHVKGKRVDLVV